MDRWAWQRAVWISSLTANAKLVALAYADHARDDLKRVWVANDRLTMLTSLSRRTVTRARDELLSAGWLTQTEPQRQHYSARYALALPSDTTDETAARETEDGHADTPQGGHTVTPQGGHAVHPGPQGGHTVRQGGHTVPQGGHGGHRLTSLPTPPHHASRELGHLDPPPPGTEAAADDDGSTTEMTPTALADSGEAESPLAELTAVILDSPGARDLDNANAVADEHARALEVAGWIPEAARKHLQRRRKQLDNAVSPPALLRGILRGMAADGPPAASEAPPGPAQRCPDHGTTYTRCCAACRSDFLTGDREPADVHGDLPPDDLRRYRERVPA